MTAQAMRSAWTAWLQDQVEAGKHVWAVVDASADLPRQVRNALDQSWQVINLLAHRTSDGAALALAPRLISMNFKRVPSVLKQLWLEQAADEPLVFFVSTSMSEQAFEEAMRKRVRAELPDGDVMLFRWWDARIWWALHQLPQAEHPEVTEFFGVFSASHWLSRDGVTRATTYAPSSDDPMAVVDQAKLSPTTFSRLLDLGEADAVLGICREQYPGALDSVVPERRHGLARGQIEWAAAEGFSDPRDHALAVRIATELGPDWHQQGEWGDLVAGAKTKRRTLLATVEAS